MPLSEEEQRLLEQMEEALAAEDPKFASTLRGTTARVRQRRGILVGIGGFVVGIGMLLGGAITLLVPLTVAGFVVMLVAAYIGLTSARHQATVADDQPDNVTPIRGKKPRPKPGQQRGSSGGSSPFMNRLEDRWRRRRDEGH